MIVYDMATKQMIACVLTFIRIVVSETGSVGQVSEAGWRDDECKGVPRFKIRADKPCSGCMFSSVVGHALSLTRKKKKLLGNASLGSKLITDSLQIHGAEARKTRYQELFRGSG